MVLVRRVAEPVESSLPQDNGRYTPGANQRLTWPKESWRLPCDEEHRCMGVTPQALTARPSGWFLHRTFAVAVA
jgi:hypothetical protein